MIDLRVDSMAVLKTLGVDGVFIDSEGEQRTVTNVEKDESGNIIIVEYS